MSRLAVEHIGTVLTKWIDQELLPKATGWQRPLTIAAGLLVAQRAVALAGKHAPVLKALGVMDEDGMILLEVAHGALQEGFTKAGKTLLFQNVVVGAEDVDKLKALAETLATE